MKALVKKINGPGLVLEQVPVPKPGPRDVLIKVKKASICGTDVHIYKWDAWAVKNVPVGTVVGHEFMGVIEEVGSEVTSFKKGQRVSGEGHITCGVCPLCQTGKRHLCPETKVIGIHRDGCFAEYFTLPEENVFLLPESVEDEIASLFDPYGNAVHTAFSTSLQGEDVLITGAGPIGIMAAAIARKSGARSVVITDLNDYRLGLARTMGATRTVNISKEKLSDVMKQEKIPHGFTVGMEMSGYPAALTTLLESARTGAHISLLGILPPNTQIDWDLVIFKMLTIKGIYGREIFKTWYQMTSLLEGGLDLKPMVTHRIRLEDYEAGFEAMFSGKCGKVVMDL